MVSLFTACRHLFCPAGLRALDSLREVLLFCLFRGGHLQAWAPPRPAPAGSSARDRRARSAPGPLGVRMRRRRRLPGTARASGTRGLRSHQPPAAPAMSFPRPDAHARLAQESCSSRVAGFPAEGSVVEIAPRAIGAIAPERAGPERASRGGVSLALASYEQRGAPARDVPARSHAEAGRRAGLEAQPERPLQARGAKQNLHGVERQKELATAAPAQKSLTQ